MSGKHKRTPTAICLGSFQIETDKYSVDTDETSSEEQDSFEDRSKWNKLKEICPGSVYTVAQKADPFDYLGLVSGSVELILSELETSTEFLEGMMEFRAIMHQILGKKLSEQMKSDKLKKEVKTQLLNIVNETYNFEDSRTSISSSSTVVYGERVETEIEDLEYERSSVETVTKIFE